MNQSCPCGCNNRKLSLSEFVVIAQTGRYFDKTNIRGACRDKDPDVNSTNNVSYAKFIAYAQGGNYFTSTQNNEQK